MDSTSFSILNTPHTQHMQQPVTNSICSEIKLHKSKCCMTQILTSLLVKARDFFFTHFQYLWKIMLFTINFSGTTALDMPISVAVCVHHHHHGPNPKFTRNRQCYKDLHSVLF